jgi:glycosyltransferase involved in cell wall biosynthesis
MLWFNHADPIDVGLPYMICVFDIMFRFYPSFPEFSRPGEWGSRDSPMRDAVQRAAIVTVGSDAAKKQVMACYGVPCERIYVLPFPTPQRAIMASGIGSAEAEIEARRVRAKYGIVGEFIFYPAQFWAHKNHIGLLRALKILRERNGRSLSLVLTGSDQGNFGHVERVITELDLTGAVHMLGFIPAEDVTALYFTAFALSYVSFFGPENLPPLEAMALGCPVVLAEMTGSRELFGEAAIYVNGHDEFAIAAGIERLFGDTELRRHLIEAGRKIALSNTCERYVHGIHNILDDFEAIRRNWPAGQYIFTQ